MRWSSNSDALENKPEASVTPVNRDPSYPDRARIDSDVRAFLRPASSPWIVFDRDSRVDDFARSALRLGAVFASSPCFIDDPKSGDVVSSVPLDTPASNPIAAVKSASSEPARPTDAFANGAVLTSAMSSVLPSTGVFPPSAGSPESVVEPSNLVVATDVIPEGSQPEEEVARASIAPAAPESGMNRKRTAWIVGAFAGVLALAGTTTAVLGRSHATTSAAPHAAEPAIAVVEATAPPVEPASTIELDDAPLPPVPGASTEAVSTTETTSAKIPVNPKSRFGKFTISPQAKHKTVWFDGKRMLGSGARSFLVFCGMHTVAVADKMDAKDVEIPCNGEYVVSK